MQKRFRTVGKTQLGCAKGNLHKLRWIFSLHVRFVNAFVVIGEIKQKYSRIFVGFVD